MEDRRSGARLGDGVGFFGFGFPGGLDVEFAELFEVDVGGAVGHEVDGFVVFREGDDFADAVLATGEHGDAVEAEGEAAVRWGAKAEGVEEVGELLLLLFGADAKDGEHFFLEFAFVDPDGAAAEFVAVEDDVVGFGADFAIFTGFEERDVFRFGAGEGVVDGDPGLVFGGEGEQWEVNDPEEVQRGAAFGEFLHVGDLDAGAAEDVAGVIPGAGVEEDEVVFFDSEFCQEGLLFGFAEEFPEGGLVFEDAFGIPLDLDEGELLDLHAGLDGEFVEADHLAGGDTGEAFGVDGADDAAVVEGGLEDFEAGVGEDVGHVDDLETVAGVGFVGAVFVHGLLVGDAGEGQGDFGAVGGFEHGDQQAFDEVDDVGLGDEGGFDVDLRELRLAVGAQVFIAEAAGDLEVALEAGDHEELFVLLRGLREGEEFGGAEAGGDEEVARAFGGGVGEDGGFDFNEALAVEVVASGGGDAVAGADVVGHPGAAQVEVAVFHPQVFVRQFAVELEGKDVGFVDDGEAGGDDFDFAGAEFAVLGAFEAFGDFAGDLDDVFVAEFVALGGEFGVFFGAEDDLGEALTIPQVHEDDAAVVAGGVDPTGEGDGLADVFGAELGAVVGAVGVRDHGRGR